MKRFLAALILMSCAVYADTPAGPYVYSSTYDGSGTNAITSHTEGLNTGLDAYVINPLTDPVNVQSIFGGVAVDPRAIRALDSGTDSVAVTGSITATSTPATLTVSGSATAVLTNVIAATDVSIYSIVSVQLTGTFVATVSFQGSNDGTTFVNINAQTVVNGTTAVVQTANAVGIYRVPVAFKFLRVRVTTFTSGTIVGTAVATASAPTDLGNRSVAVTGAVTAAQGNSAAIGNSWFTRISDAVDGPVQVLPASASPVATDVALVTALSPNGNQATAANQVTGNNSLASIDTKLTSPLAVTGPLTDLELRASDVPVSIAALPLPTGAATAANQATALASLSSIDTKLTSPLAVTVTDVATETTLSALNTKVPSGLTVTATRLLVDGSGVTQPVSAAALPLPAGASTAANQTTANASLSSIDTKLTSPLAVTSNQTQINGVAVSTGNGVVGTGVQRVAIASDNSPVSTLAPSVASAALSNATNSNSTFTVIAANASRKGLIIHNDSTTTCFYAFAATSSNTAFTLRLTNQSSYSMQPPIYTGVVSAICNATNGASRVTEL